MSVWSLAAAAVLAGSAAGVSHLGAQEAQGNPAPTVEVQSEQRVSISFNHASVGDVLDWMTKNGASFVAADSELPKDATITLNVKDEPMNEVLDAVASALGGHWERRGHMRIFRKGEDRFRVFGGDGAWSTGDGDNMFHVLPNGKSLWSEGDKGKMFQIKPGENGMWKDGVSGKVFQLAPGEKGNFKVFGDGKDGGQIFISPDGDEHTFVMPDMPNLEHLKDLPGMDAQSRKELENALKASRKAMGDSGMQMRISKKAMEQARKEMEKARKEHPEAFNGKVFISPDGDKFTHMWVMPDMEHMKELHEMPGMDAAARKEMEQALTESRKAMDESGMEMRATKKAMEQARVEMEKMRKEHPDMFNGKTFVMPHGADGKMFQYKWDSDGLKGSKDFAPQVWVTRSSGDMTKLLSSLSPEQREKNRRQGYLHASDLSAAQRKMLGTPSSGKGWTITISKNGESITVKSDD